MVRFCFIWRQNRKLLQVFFVYNIERSFIDMKGYIHSLETFGTVDGPGVRFVVFFQGCPMRCMYCHNPDTWIKEDGKLIDTDEIIEKFERNRDFYTTGGITATGGEPMYQMEFLTELFTKAHDRKIHTCLDTSGIMYQGQPEVDRLMEVTDLVMLDIKHIDDLEHKKLTGHSNKNILKFAEYLNDISKPVWIRHVVVPGITYDKEELTGFASYIKRFSNIEKVEVLPYHSMGKVKYENLGIEYRLADTPQLTKEEKADAEKIINSILKR